MMCLCGSRDCDGSCLQCEAAAKPYLEDDYGTAIYSGEAYYYIDGEIIAEENIEKWLADYKVIANDD